MSTYFSLQRLSLLPFLLSSYTLSSVQADSKAEITAGEDGPIYALNYAVEPDTFLNNFEIQSSHDDQHTLLWEFLNRSSVTNDYSPLLSVERESIRIGLTDTVSPRGHQVAAVHSEEYFDVTSKLSLKHGLVLVDYEGLQFNSPLCHTFLNYLHFTPNNVTLVKLLDNPDDVRNATCAIRPSGVRVARSVNCVTALQEFCTAWPSSEAKTLHENDTLRDGVNLMHWTSDSFSMWVFPRSSMPKTVLASSFSLGSLGEPHLNVTNFNQTQFGIEGLELSFRVPVSSSCDDAANPDSCYFSVRGSDPLSGNDLWKIRTIRTLALNKQLEEEPENIYKPANKTSSVKPKVSAASRVPKSSKTSSVRTAALPIASGAAVSDNGEGCRAYEKMDVTLPGAGQPVEASPSTPEIANGKVGITGSVSMSNEIAASTAEVSASASTANHVLKAKAQETPIHRATSGTVHNVLPTPVVAATVTGGIKAIVETRSTYSVPSEHTSYIAPKKLLVPRNLDGVLEFSVTVPFAAAAAPLTRTAAEETRASTTKLVENKPSGRKIERVSYTDDNLGNYFIVPTTASGPSIYTTPFPSVKVGDQVVVGQDQASDQVMGSTYGGDDGDDESESDSGDEEEGSESDSDDSESESDDDDEDEDEGESSDDSEDSGSEDDGDGYGTGEDEWAGTYGSSVQGQSSGGASVAVDENPVTVANSESGSNAAPGFPSEISENGVGGQYGAQSSPFAGVYGSPSPDPVVQSISPGVGMPMPESIDFEPEPTLDDSIEPSEFEGFPAQATADPVAYGRYLG